MRISNNPYHNSYYARYDKNVVLHAFIFVLITWPVWAYIAFSIFASITK
jgi:hypothetical protein